MKDIRINLSNRKLINPQQAPRTKSVSREEKINVQVSKN